MRFNKQLIESKSVIEDKKKWIDEKSNKWIQLKLYSFSYYRFKIEDLIDWLSWKTKLQWFDRRTCRRSVSLPDRN